MGKKQKCIHRIVLLTLCSVLLIGSFSFSEVHSVKAANNIGTVNTIVKAAKKNGKTTKKKNTSSAKSKKEASVKNTEEAVWDSMKNAFVATAKVTTTIASGRVKNMKKKQEENSAVKTMKKAPEAVKKAVKKKQAKQKKYLEKEYATSNDYSWITKGSTKSKNYDTYIGNFKVEIGSLIQLLTVIAVIVAGVSIRIVGSKYAWTKNGMKRRENHEQLITIFLAICAILGLGTILALAQQIGEGIFK